MQKIFGAEAKVYLNYEGDIHSLAEKLNKKLHIDITIENREDPPYDFTGMCQTLGIEIWLNSSDKEPRYAYELELRTELRIGEFMNGQMHDLSLWLARFITMVCKVETLVLLENDEVVFKIDS
ncbi:hypothetical protein ACDQ55_14550 [Chitinophaga sp. 30R24]|uniref:hypothetical protein n=1 Tax=Chitinophaga sp. 30R24 TaxID=3248838 RepID=UPI003B8FA840